ncbi:O-antigen ligase family protein [Oscillatoriales cyanobacterium LEGE 11467]|uniref:O-antigen ligase family protein n=2 Tax=Zarconia TaxID=2992130 RepID=A0A928W375_9CYAN|nr:O-antigen ligase family protein [Zarconia navalis LEGE 11467]
MPQLLSSDSPSNSDKPWIYLQIGLLLLPLSPFLGGLGVVIATVWTWKQRFKSIVCSRLNQGFALFLGLLVLSASTALDPESAFLGLFNFWPFIFIFAAASLLLGTPDRLRRMSWILAIASAPVALIGIGQMFSGWTGPIDLGMVVNWPLESEGTPTGRMASVFDYANVLANYSAIVFLLVLGLWIETFRALRGLTLAQKEMRYARGIRWRWRFLNGLLVSHAIAIVLTSSRNAWGVTVLGCLVYGLYLGLRPLVLGITAYGGVVLGASFAPPPLQSWFQAIVPDNLWMRLSDRLYPDRPDALLRVTQWEFAGNLTLERPWTGWGLRSFTALYEAQKELWLGHPHSLALMMTAETGIPATLLLFGLAGWIMFRGVRLLARWHSLSVPAEAGEEGLEISTPPPSDRLIFLSYLVAFGAMALFHLVDVTLFDSRINLLGWLLLAAIWSVVREGERNFK